MKKTVVILEKRCFSMNDADMIEAVKMWVQNKMPEIGFDTIGFSVWSNESGHDAMASVELCRTVEVDVGG